MDITIKSENRAKILDAIFLGKQEIEFKISDGILKADVANYHARQPLWVNVKLENETVPNTNRIMIEDREISFGNLLGSGE